jgi:hypothetical protein
MSSAKDKKKLSLLLLANNLLLKKLLRRLLLMSPDIKHCHINYFATGILIKRKGGGE